VYSTLHVTHTECTVHFMLHIRSVQYTSCYAYGVYHTVHSSDTHRQGKLQQLNSLNSASHIVNYCL